MDSFTIPLVTTLNKTKFTLLVGGNETLVYPV